jgi:hypothetical protein
MTNYHFVFLNKSYIPDNSKFQKNELTSIQTLQIRKSNLVCFSNKSVNIISGEI